jgi:hypothetical protein
LRIEATLEESAGAARVLSARITSSGASVLRVRFTVAMAALDAHEAV